MNKYKESASIRRGSPFVVIRDKRGVNKSFISREKKKKKRKRKKKENLAGIK